jgi:hypothetical protein
MASGKRVETQFISAQSGDLPVDGDLGEPIYENAMGAFQLAGLPTVSQQISPLGEPSIQRTVSSTLSVSPVANALVDDTVNRQAVGFIGLVTAIVNVQIRSLKLRYYTGLLWFDVAGKPSRCSTPGILRRPQCAFISPAAINVNTCAF